MSRSMCRRVSIRSSSMSQSLKSAIFLQSQATRNLHMTSLLQTTTNQRTMRQRTKSTAPVAITISRESRGKSSTITRVTTLDTSMSSSARRTGISLHQGKLSVSTLIKMNSITRNAVSVMLTTTPVLLSSMMSRNVSDPSNTPASLEPKVRSLTMVENVTLSGSNVNPPHTTLPKMPSKPPANTKLTALPRRNHHTTRQHETTTTTTPAITKSKALSTRDH